MTEATDRIRDVVLPLLAARELELYDIELHDTLVRVIVDRPGGVDLDALGALTRDVSRALDQADPITHRYTLEVSSPGVERRLRTPDHFIGAVGETVKVKTTVEVDGQRRFEGVLAAAGESGITIRAAEGGGDGEPASEHTLGYGDIARARTVFEWGSSRQATSGRNKKKRERKA